MRGERSVVVQPGTSVKRFLCPACRRVGAVFHFICTSGSRVFIRYSLKQFRMRLQWALGSFKNNNMYLQSAMAMMRRSLVVAAALFVYVCAAGYGAGTHSPLRSKLYQTSRARLALARARGDRAFSVML